MTDDTRPSLEHARMCQRRGVPMLRAAWDGSPQYWCPSCGKYADALDQRTAHAPQDAPRAPLSHPDAASVHEPAPTPSTPHGPERNPS